MSACHIKLGNWRRALETADKVIWDPGLLHPLIIKKWLFECQALGKNENNYKAIFRKGKALGELGYFEKAEKLLEGLAVRDVNGLSDQVKLCFRYYDLTLFCLDAPKINQELSRLRAIDNEREKQNKDKMRGKNLFFSPFANRRFCWGSRSSQVSYRKPGRSPSARIQRLRHRYRRSARPRHPRPTTYESGSGLVEPDT